MKDKDVSIISGSLQPTGTESVRVVTIQESFQPRGKELEYSIVAVNKTGYSEPSNTAMVVL